jgi:hypothetical protein
MIVSTSGLTNTEVLIALACRACNLSVTYNAGQYHELKDQINTWLINTFDDEDVLKIASLELTIISAAGKQARTVDLNVTITMLRSEIDVAGFDALYGENAASDALDNLRTQKQNESQLAASPRSVSPLSPMHSSVAGSPSAGSPVHSRSPSRTEGAASSLIFRRPSLSKAFSGLSMGSPGAAATQSGSGADVVASYQTIDPGSPAPASPRSLGLPSPRRKSSFAAVASMAGSLSSVMKTTTRVKSGEFKPAPGG